MKMIVHVEGMHCIRCAGKVEGAMHDLGLDAVVDLEKKICTVEGDCDKEAIYEAIEELGFQVTGIE